MTFSIPRFISTSSEIAKVTDFFWIFADLEEVDKCYIWVTPLPILNILCKNNFCSPIIWYLGSDKISNSSPFLVHLQQSEINEFQQTIKKKKLQAISEIQEKEALAFKQEMIILPDSGSRMTLRRRAAKNNIVTNIRAGLHWRHWPIML